ncbi:MAG: hypothetical protein ACJ8F1_08775 [Polyangia bacterium]
MACFGVVRVGSRLMCGLLFSTVLCFGCVPGGTDDSGGSTRRSAALGAFAGVLTQHNDLARTGANLNETILNVSNVKAGTFGKLKALKVAGQVYAQPLYMPAAISGLNVVFLATEQNNVYAYHADSPYELLWSRTDFELPWASTACGNTQPFLGISSTPVIDPTSNTLYVTSKTNQGGVFKYMLHALDLTTGKDRTGSPIDMSLDVNKKPVSVPGTGDGSVSGTLTFDPMRHLNRVALTLSQNVLFVGFASHCDQGNYHGWILRFDTRTSPPTPLTPFVTNPNTGHGGLWMGGAGFSVDANNDLYFVSGDGEDGKTTTDGHQLANAFVHLGTVGAGQTPSIVSWFMPSDVATLDHNDKDLGSAGPLLIPGTNRILGGGKGGIYYLLDRTTMGGFAAGSPPETQIIQRFAPTAAGNWIVGSPIFWNSPAGARVYTWPGKTPLEAYAFDLTTQKFSSTTPVSQSIDNPQNDPQGGHLSLSANGSTAGTGIVWANHGLASAGGGDAVAGALYAFNAEDLSKKLWDSTQVTADALTSYAKYTPPTVANGKVYVGTFSDEVDVYGILPTPFDAGVRDAAHDLGGGTVLSCGNFDGGAPQPTTWTYVYNTYFAAGTAGHCANCHGTVTHDNFLSGFTKDSFYAGLVTVGQITPASGATSPIGDPAKSALAWFGPARALGPGINVFMPADNRQLNAAAVAAVCGWVAAGAFNDAANGTACTTGAQCTSGFCVDGFCCNAACSGSCTACSAAKTGGTNGTCANSAAGTADSRCTAVTTCGLTGACTGSGTCAVASSTTACRAATCSGGTATAAATCNGAGACPAPVTQTCSPLVCGSTACKTTCAADTDCIAGDFCSTGTCTPKKATGGTCMATNQCSSGFCVDGFCCNTACTGSCTACSNARTGGTNGTCGNIPVGVADTRCGSPAPPCGKTGACTGTGACAFAPTTTACGAASCTNGIATPATNCNGTGACTAPVTSSCAPYLCGSTACANACTTAANCVAGAQCTGGHCVLCAGGTCLANGAACTASNQCGSGSCVDGFCCNVACTGACTACSNARTGTANGTCANVVAGAADSRCTLGATCGNTGTCTAVGTCALAPTTTVCAAASCTNGVATPAAKCNGAGVCATPTPVSCAPLTCGSTTCKTTCSVDTDCIAGDFCTAGTCTPKKAIGGTCTATTQCSSGFCVDGFCCSTACTGACTACSAAKTGGTSGTCANVATGTTDTRCVHSTTCGNTGACTGTGTCALAPATTACAAASCSSGVATPAANCNGAGACTTAVTTACAPYVCGATACKTSCAAASDCVAGDTCTAGVCAAPATCTATIAVVDDFEDGNNQLRLLDGRTGALYTYKDTVGSTITPAAGATFTPTAPGDVTPAFAAHVTGTLANTTTVWAGFGMDFLSPKALYNGAKYTGISFYAKKGSSSATGAVRVKVPDRNTDPVGGVCTSCSNDFGSDLTLTTTWTKFTIPFSSMTQQAGWGAPRPANVDRTGIVAIQFQVTAQAAAYDIWVDDVTFTCN